MTCLHTFQRDWFSILFLAGILSMVTATTLIDTSSASAATKKSKQVVTSAEATACTL